MPITPQKPQPKPAASPATKPAPLEEAAEELEEAKEDTVAMLLRKNKEKDAVIAKMKKETVDRALYDELVADVADGKYNPVAEEEEEEQEPEQSIEEVVKGLFSIGKKSIRDRVGNREAIRRQVEAVKRIQAVTGQNPLISAGTPIDSQEKAEQWMTFMENALHKSTDDATFELYCRQNVRK